MLRRLSFFLLFSLIFAQEPETSAEQSFVASDFFDIEAIVAKISKKNKNLASRSMLFKEFTQQHGLRQGEIKLKSPDKMKVVYFFAGQPFLEMYANNDLINIHLIPHKIVYQQDVAERQNALKVLDIDYLVSLYQFSFFDKKGKHPLFDEKERKKFNLLSEEPLPMTYHLVLTPRDKTLSFDTIEMWVDEKGQIWRTLSRDIEDHEVEFYFYLIKDNDFIADSEFDFIVPANVRTVKNLVDTKGKNF